MFSTSCVSNALAVKFAAEAGVYISWGRWAASASVPGVVCLLLMPLAIYLLQPPSVKETPDAPEKARAELARAGPMSRDEWVTAAALSITVSLWIFGPALGVDNVAAALCGLVLLLLSGVVSWQDCLDNGQAWDTLVWFAALIAMASALNREGFIPWLAAQVVRAVGGLRLGWPAASLLVVGTYFYSHYLFASISAHVGSMYGAFLAVAVSCGAPPVPAALALAQLSALMGCLTVYGISSAPLYFNCGFVGQAEWYRTGLVLSVFYIAVWLAIGGLWWKAIGLFDEGRI